ncbi:MAG: DeoR/GlpR family DNA-binding transcription regulator [Ferruginibacter sp.]
MLSNTIESKTLSSLSKKERKDLIVKQVNIHTRLMFTELVNLINVSEDTIRRDVNELTEDGQLIKIKGGAMSAGYNNSAGKEIYAQSGKTIIAEKALSLLKDDMIVLLGGGTTIREFIKKIPVTLKATFITVNPVSAVELLHKPLIKTIMIGGQISGYSQMVISFEAFEYLKNIKADLCIIGTNSIDVENGLTDSDWETIQVKKAMLKAAEKIAVFAISEKLDSAMQLKIAGLDEINYLITELDPDNIALQNYKVATLTIL